MLLYIELAKNNDLFFNCICRQIEVGKRKNRASIEQIIIYKTFYFTLRKKDSEKHDFRKPLRMACSKGFRARKKSKKILTIGIANFR